MARPRGTSYNSCLIRRNKDRSAPAPEPGLQPDPDQPRLARGLCPPVVLQAILTLPDSPDRRGSPVRNRIVFNGHEYSSIEEMPDDVRRAFQDKLALLTKDADHDGVPDVLQRKDIGAEGLAIAINGHTIANIHDLP